MGHWEDMYDSAPEMVAENAAIAQINASAGSLEMAAEALERVYPGHHTDAVRVLNTLAKVKRDASVATGP